jgi:acyl-coenzyme A thioesterase PaaI-like protein
MEITDIPFVKKVGIEKNSNGELELGFDDSVQNHIQTIHASALFSLAEAASGEALQITFPELVGKVVPVVRDSQIKFKKPATKPITAYPDISVDAQEKFKEQFGKKGRSSIVVDVEIKDSDGVVVCFGSFSWFVQSVA